MDPEFRSANLSALKVRRVIFMVPGGIPLTFPLKSLKGQFEICSSTGQTDIKKETFLILMPPRCSSSVLPSGQTCVSLATLLLTQANLSFLLF